MQDEMPVLQLSSVLMQVDVKLVAVVVKTWFCLAKKLQERWRTSKQHLHDVQQHIATRMETMPEGVRLAFVILKLRQLLLLHFILNGASHNPMQWYCPGGVLLIDSTHGAVSLLSTVPSRILCCGRSS
eukprot:1160496-Pelagomonas_calceolata.AAC.2